MHTPGSLSCNSCLSWLAILLLLSSATAAEFELNGHKFTVPDGFVVEQIAGQPLVDRPVSADFDERGRMYVTDSSGSNEPVEVQREKRPHRIMRLDDVDGDGVFDKSTVYADKLMFPEGSCWFNGSLYVAAPPEIWKFTDADDDGVAEKREVWFDGKTLTHCANDLHGPYLGPDGWMYWCKGAFAEQSLERPGQPPLETKAAHIFRRRPEGGPYEHVMTGGMDNPVEVVFTPGGERISVIRDDNGRIVTVRYVLPRHKAASWVGPGRKRTSTRPGANGVVELSPFEFLDRLADLFPQPRKHRHRYHGVFAPNHPLRPAVTGLAIGNVGKQAAAAISGHEGHDHHAGCGDSGQKPRSHDTSRIAWAKLMARVGEEFPLQCPGCGGDIRLISFITEPGPIRRILTHLGEPLEPQPVSPARGPPTDWAELVQVHDDRDIFQSSPDELPVIDIHSL